MKDTTTETTCPWTDADECAMAAERSVAGTSDTVPGCAEHERPATRTYTITLKIGAARAGTLPTSAGDLLHSIEDGLPREWFDPSDPDAFRIAETWIRTGSPYAPFTTTDRELAADALRFAATLHRLVGDDDRAGRCDVLATLMVRP
jgi:hypothetical protein